jgi:NitT/TauT family transport system ATP-binding protein
MDPRAPTRGALRFSNVVKTYGTESERVLAVDHCSLDITPGEIFMVVGPSGCGKTTLLNAVAGFHGIDAGTIHLDGRMLCGPGQPQAAPGPDRVVVFQEGALFPWKTILENVAFGPVVQGRMRRREALEKARALMADAGLGGYEHDYPGAASSGVQRRVEIVRALMNDPAVLLLDEPYRALDRITRSLMHESLLEIQARSRATIFFITHDLEEAVFLGHRVAIMTARPCRPKRVFDIDLPRPRDHTVITTPRFRELVQMISETVHEEALQAFTQGDSEGGLPAAA